MSKKLLLSLAAAVFICSLRPAEGQSRIQLPDGDGKQTVETVCATCHTLDRVVDAGLNRDGWQFVIKIMLNNGAPLTEDQIPVVVDYLAKNYPEKPQPPAAVIAGSVRATLKEWTLPTPNSGPHDPLVAPDGSVWYTGQLTNLLGRFDPKTGQFKEYHLKTPDSGPHGLVADKDGNIWFTANFGGYVGKLDPKNGEVTEYLMPDPAAKDPHTPIFDPSGTLWFTIQGANMIGRILPKTGEVKLLRVPTPRAQPYGMVVNSKGVPFFCEFNTNKLASIDPSTLEIREYVLPNPDSRPRRIAITSDDVIWYGDFARGYLGRFDTKSGKGSEWPSPGGPKSEPYGINVVNDVVWYSESGVKPNTVVRFDPKREKFQTWIIPSGGGVVRNMVHGPDGNLWLACSGVNRIAEVELNNNDRPADGAKKGQ
jgi:virginiamycin B lyase